MSWRIRRFQATLPTIREEKKSDNYHRIQKTPHIVEHNIRRHVASGLCKKDHRLETCAAYSSHNLYKKYEGVIKHRYCINCLARSHETNGCTSRNWCFTCNEKHHSSLHGHPRVYASNEIKVIEKAKSQTLPIGTRLPTLLAKQTLVPTTIIRLKCNGVLHKVPRANLNPILKKTNVAALPVRQTKLQN